MRSTKVLDIREMVRRMRAGSGDRETARAMGVGRNTAAKYRAWAKQHGWLELSSELPDAATIQAHVHEIRVRAEPSLSRLEPYREYIQDLRGQGVEIAVIRQRLEQERQFKCSYASLWRYIRQMEWTVEDIDLVVRVETKPGEEAQVDFGGAGRMYDPGTGQRRKAWAFIMTLSWSRHQYVRFVFDQKVETWLECHRLAFESFGGVPKRVVLDNLKAAIVKACFDDPQVQRAYRECAEHYGFLIAPCRVRKPQHKGKVENGVHYIQRNFLAGRHFDTVECDVRTANREVQTWVRETAGRRVHGTTKQPPLERFATVEREKLAPLPEKAFEVVEWLECKLHRDCHIVFDGSFYSAPYRLAGQFLSVRATRREVSIYDCEFNRVATHTRAEVPGTKRTLEGHEPPHKLLGLLPIPEACQARAAEIGPHTAQVVSALLSERPVDRSRVAQRIIRLAEKHGDALLELACKRTVDCGDISGATVRNMLKIVSHPAAQWVEQTPPMIGMPIFARHPDELIPALPPTLPQALPAPDGEAGHARE